MRVLVGGDNREKGTVRVIVAQVGWGLVGVAGNRKIKQKNRRE